MELDYEIQEAAEKLSGDRNTRFAYLAPVVAELLMTQLPKNVSLDSCRTSVVFAGAFMLLSYAHVLDQNDLSGFDAGTLKLSFRDRTDSYAQIAKQIMAPWCHDSAAFCGVRA